jgi:hypothetical protein
MSDMAGEGLESRVLSAKRRGEMGKGSRAFYRASLGRKSPMVAKSSVAGTLAQFQPAHGRAGVPGAARPWSAGFQGGCFPLGGFHKAAAFGQGWSKGGTPLDGGSKGAVSPLWRGALRSNV